MAPFRNKSRTRIAQAEARRKISGYARSMGGSTASMPLIVSQLARRDVLQQLVDRGVHDLGEGRRMQAKPEHRDYEQRENQELAWIGIAQLGNMLVADRAEDHPLVHPQRVRRAEDERRSRQGGDPE